MKKRAPISNLTSRVMIFIVIVALTLGCVYRPPTSQKIIRIKGSDTMLILTRRWAESYMTTHPGISVYAEGGGSATGVQALIRGTIDICAASRPLTSDEVKPLAKKYRSIGVSILVAKDALSVYLNPKNPVTDLTLKQLKQIFGGKVQDWRSVGGNDEKIKVFIRPQSSGTHLYFREHILEGAEYGINAIPIPTTAAIVDSILSNPNAIGYGGIAYGSEVTHSQINGINPSEENVRYDLYPLSRYLYFYTVRKPQGEVKKFIDWVIGARGQEIVGEVGYIPLWITQ